uniref:Tissue factor n=1 Tax=Anabas testudineus TaxID=64144 RepID=A0AAQ6IR32_ANATE
MASLIYVFYLGVCLSAWVTKIADSNVPKAENVRWVSLDFKTILTWTANASDHTYTVLYSWDDNNWNESPNCIQVSESECDLTNEFLAYDRAYSADIKTEPVMDYNNDQEELPHTFSPKFNPYRQSNISAVKFTVRAVDESRVMVNITDHLTGIYKDAKQLSIRDVLRNGLKYKISYWKSGSTGKRDIISDSSIAEVSELDAGVSYCFMVAAYIPSRTKTKQHGAWSKQHCTHGQRNTLQAPGPYGTVSGSRSGPQSAC